MSIEVSANLADNICKKYGEEGKQWLADLPHILMLCQEQWNISELQKPYKSSCNLVLPVRIENNKEAVLKIGFPGEKEVFTEIKTIQLLQAKPIVPLLQSDLVHAAMLLEKVTSGTTLTELQQQNDAEATKIAAALIRDIPTQVTDTPFPSVQDWAEIIPVMHNKTSVIPNAMLQTATDLVHKLSASAPVEMLLHGDLHHDNILYDEHKGWLVIDPKGVIGDPVFNAARLLNNPRHIVHDIGMMTERLNILSEVLQTDMVRIASWGFVDCIISACWTLEENGKPDTDLHCAQLLQTFLD